MDRKHLKYIFIANLWHCFLYDFDILYNKKVFRLFKAIKEIYTILIVTSKIWMYTTVTPLFPRLCNLIATQMYECVSEPIMYLVTIYLWVNDWSWDTENMCKRKWLFIARLDSKVRLQIVHLRWDEWNNCGSNFRQNISFGLISK